MVACVEPACSVRHPYIHSTDLIYVCNFVVQSFFFKGSGDLPSSTVSLPPLVHRRWMMSWRRCRRNTPKPGTRRLRHGPVEVTRAADYKSTSTRETGSRYSFFHHILSCVKIISNNISFNSLGQELKVQEIRLDGLGLMKMVQALECGAGGLGF